MDILFRKTEPTQSTVKHAKSPFLPLSSRSIPMFSAQSRLRHAAADTFAMVIYCSVVNMMIEIFLSGMSFEQSLSSRLVAIPVNILIAWPYGFYRDWMMRYARRLSPAKWMKNLADVVAYVTFQSPVYVLILLSVGADWPQIAAAVSSNIVVSMVMGAAYGYFLDYCRRLFRVSQYA
jgi:hypothetical protein